MQLQVYLSRNPFVKASDISSVNAMSSLSDEAFEALFKTYYKSLHAYANVILKDGDLAEEIVQAMFLKLWEKRHLLQVQTSIKAYLYKCIYNDSLNYIRNQKTKTKYEDFTVLTMNQHHEPASFQAELGELHQNLSLALNELPEQCRTIFQMSRFEELKYREIAGELGLSVKTVENQIGKALKILRVKLADFLVLVLALILYCRDFFN
jgi:RNA polymerase sigma-70 factor (ECF subfamily)